LLDPTIVGVLEKGEREVSRIRNRGARRALLSLVAMTMLVALAPAAARAGSAAPSTTYAFPSATSSVVASVGFIDATQVGYFWSVSRGDSVTETFSGPASITQVGLKVSVPTNALNSGAYVAWSLEINGTPVARFKVPQGFVGAKKLFKTFSAITGPTYTVKLRVTNEVAPGQGSITLVYAGTQPHILLLQ
jgi:hypothetical protein